MLIFLVVAPVGLAESPNSGGHTADVKSLYRMTREATSAYNLGDYDVALDLFERALVIAERVLPAEHEDRLAIINNIALLYKEKGRYADAEPLYIKILAIRESRLGPDHQQTVISRNNLGALYRAQGRYAETEPLYVQNLAICERAFGPEARLTIVSRNNLALLYKHQDRLAEAAALYTQNLPISERVLGPEDPLTMTARANLASVRDTQGHYAEAESLLIQNIAIGERILAHHHPQLLAARNNLALLYGHQHRYDESERLYRENVSITEGALGPEHPLTLTARENLGVFYMAQHREGEAKPFLVETLKTRERVLGVDHPDTLTNRVNAALFMLGKSEQDVPEAKRLIDAGLVASARRLQSELGQGPSDAGRRGLLLETVGGNLALSVATTFADGASIGARGMLLTKGIAGEIDAALRRIAATEPALAEVAKELQKAEAALDQAMQLRDPAMIDERRAVRDALARDVTAKSREFAIATAVDDLRPEVVAAVLPANTVFLDYGIYKPIDFKTGDRSPEHVFLALYRPRAVVEAHDLGPVAQIVTDIERLAQLNKLEILPRCQLNPAPGCPIGKELAQVKALIAPDNSADASVAAAKQRLADFLLAPLGAIGSDTQLIISPDGPLHKLNFDLLAVRGRHLFETNELRIIPHGRVLVQKRSKPITPQADLLAIGGGDYGALPEGVKACDNRSLRAGGAFCALPNAEVEAQRVAALARARSLSIRGPYVGHASTAAVVKAEMPGSRIAHLATHAATNLVGGDLGLYNVALAFTGANDALGSKRAAGGQVTEDGLLYGYEASRLPLYGTELVTLSACQTALGDTGDSEGFYSLAYAFRLAGADNVLMSLWSVDDAQTGAFMEMLYDAWFARRAGQTSETAGESLRRALRATRLEARNRPDFAARHWAAFVLVEN